MTCSMTRRGAGALLGALTLAPLAQAQTPENLARYMRNMATHGFGGQVLAARRGDVVLDAAYGWADRQGRERMTERTPIGIASATKQFTAAAVLKLAEAGLLALDEPIGRHLPAAPADKAALTLHQLLSHTAGLAGVDLAHDFEAVSRADMLARVYAAQLVSAPGEQWRYSNAGYNLAAAVIEAVSGQTSEEFLAAALFRPAGLRATSVAARAATRRTPAAHAYRAWLDQASPPSWPRRNYRAWGGGDVFSTAQDLYRWQQALEGGRVLSPASVARLLEAHARPNPEGTLAYGYGAFIDNGENGRFIERSGDWERGYNAAWHRWPEEDLTLIIVANGVAYNNVSMRQAVQAELEQMLRGVTLEAMPPDSVKPPRATRRRLAGVYMIAGGAKLQLIDDGAHLWAAAQNQAALELMLPSLPAERRDTYRAATAKTERLFANVSRDAYAEAVGRPEIVDEYWSEWTGFVAAHGDLQHCEVLGTSRQGRAARTLARLRFARGEIVLMLLWADLGAGQLRGTAVFTGAPTSYACVLAGAGEDALIGYDPLSGARFDCVIRGENALAIASPGGEVVLNRS